MIFTSKQFPGVKMNRYGNIFAPTGARITSRRTRDAVWREAKQAGCYLASSDREEDGDGGNGWFAPVKEFLTWQEKALRILSCFEASVDTKKGRPDCKCSKCNSYRRAKAIYES